MADEKIKVELDLDLSKAEKDASNLQETISGVGDEAADAGQKGSGEFDKFGKSALGVAAGVAGVSVGLAGVVGLMVQVHENQLAINQATAENIRIQQGRIGAAAATLGSPLIRNLAQMLSTPERKVSEVEAFRRSTSLAAAVDLPPDAVAQMLLDIAPRIGVQAGGDVAIFARGTGTSAPASGQLFSILHEQFKLRGAPRREAAARVAGVAQKSALTPENLLRILTPTAALLKQAGIETPVEQAAFAAAFAQFEPPDQPELTKTALKQMARLVTKQVDSFTGQLLRDAGVADPDNPTLPDLVTAYQKFLQGGKTADERRARVRILAKRTNIPPRVLEKIAFTAVDSFTEVFERTLEAGRGSTFADIQAAAVRRIATPAAQARSAAVRKQLQEVTVGAIPGTGPEAASLLNQFVSAEGITDPEATEAEVQRFRTRMIRAGFTDERLTAEQSRELFFLLRVWKRRVRPALIAVQAEGPDANISQVAGELVRRGDLFASQAQTFQFIGSQGGEVDKLLNLLKEAIEFLRSVQLGQPVDFNVTVPGLMVNPNVPLTTQAVPSAEQRAAAGSTNIAPITAGGVVNNISQQINIIGGEDPATVPDTRDGTKGAPE